jgi:CRISPR-associated protein Cas8a1/Csx13
MAKAVKKTKSVVAAPPLVIGLGDPGMTPLLRAGLGGLAASLRAISLERDPKVSWPAPVALGSGLVTVEPQRVTITWGEAGPKEVLEALFAKSFQIRAPYGLIDLPGARDPQAPPPPALGVALQSALKKTFLQHGKTTTKAGLQKPISLSIDDQVLTFGVQGYSMFVHQGAWEDVLKATLDGDTELAGWAYPGAAQRHIAFPATKCSYTAGQALCGCFALVGCVSYCVPRSGGGVIVIVEPSDLVRFAVVRGRLAPRVLADAFLTGAGDAVLAVELALRLDDLARERPGVASTSGVMLRATPWAKQQKSRVSTASGDGISEERLDVYHDMRNALPTTIRATTLKGDEASEDGSTDDGFFAATSALRAFIAENIATGRPWFTGFAIATTGGKKPRLIHYYRDRDKNNLGALYPDEKKGLIAMLPHLEDSERALVRSVHVALRQRFGAIAEECRDNPATMKNRFQGERDRWRLAFAGSKTPEQIRAALADLWSRAGSNAELKEHWQTILPLLGPANWQAARDLGLVALASYQGSGLEEAAEADERAPTSKG